MRQLNPKSLKLLELFHDLSYLDLLGIGYLLKVKEEKEFDEYLTQIIAAFEDLSEEKQNEIVELTENVASANKEKETEEIEECSKPSIISKIKEAIYGN